MNDLFSQEFYYGQIQTSFQKVGEPGPKITCSSDLAKFAREKFTIDLHLQEAFYAFPVNRTNSILGHILVSIGGVSGTVVDPKILFSRILQYPGVSGFIVAHNHPSGNMTPSRQDIDITNKLKKGGELLDLRLLDHIILSPENSTYYSFADEATL